MKRRSIIPTEGQRSSLALTPEDVMNEVFSNPHRATRIYRSLAKCAPYARFKKRRNTMARKMLEHMMPLVLRSLRANIDWEAMGMQVIYRYKMEKFFRTEPRRSVPFRRRKK